MGHTAVTARWIQKRINNIDLNDPLRKAIIKSIKQLIPNRK